MVFVMIKRDEYLFLKKLARNLLHPYALEWFSNLSGGNQALRKTIRRVAYLSKSDLGVVVYRNIKERDQSLRKKKKCDRISKLPRGPRIAHFKTTLTGFEGQGG